MRARAVLVATMLLCATACGLNRTAADQSSDASTVANALRAVDESGSSFAMTETLSAHGGDIPQGRAEQLNSQAAGKVRQGVTSMTYKLKEQQGTVAFEMIVARGLLFARPAGSGSWKATSAAGTTVFYPAVRLDLLRETVLLARSVSSSSIAFQGGLTHKYAVTPGSTQLEQFEGVSFDSATEQAFLKSASAEVDFFLSIRGDSLTRIEVHMSAVDQSNNETQTVDSTADFKGGRVAAITLPATAQSVQPSQILSP